MTSNMIMKMQAQFCVLFVRIIMLLRITEGNNINSLSSTNVTHKPSEVGCEGGTLLSTYVCIPQGYLVGEVPELPTIVNTRIEINNILEVNDKKMRITLDFYQELLWVDDRIKTFFPSEHPNKMSVLNNNLIDYIWKPDLWIRFFLWIRSDSNLSFWERNPHPRTTWSRSHSLKFSAGVSVWNNLGTACILFDLFSFGNFSAKSFLFY